MVVEKPARSKKRNEIRHGTTILGCRMRPVFFSVPAGSRKLKPKTNNNPSDEMIEETIYEKFWLMHPCAYVKHPLKVRMQRAFDRVMNGETKKVELSLERWPQVASVMGELLATVPKKKRPICGYTSKEENNTLFVIQAS